MTVVDPAPTCVPGAVAAWLDGPARDAGPLTGFRLFAAADAAAVPDPTTARWPLIQVHVARSGAEGHVGLLHELARHRVTALPLRLDGLGVAAHLVDAEGRRSWVGPVLGRTVVPAGEPGTQTDTVGLVLRFPDVADLHRTWALLDRLGDDLYDQQVLDRSAHLPAGAPAPEHTTPVSELHVRGDDGSRLVHLHTGRHGSGTAWVACRPGRFELGHWIRNDEEIPA